MTAFYSRLSRAFATTSYYGAAYLGLFLLQHFLTKGDFARRTGMSLWQLVGLHIVGAVVVALVLAAFPGMLQTRIRAMALGAALAAPFGALLSIQMYPQGSVKQHALAALIVGVTLGCVTAGVLWDKAAN